MLSKYSWDNIAQETFSTGAMLAQTTYRSSHQRCSVKKCVLKNFTLFTGKHLCWSLSLIKLQGLQPSNFIKKRLQHRSFPVNNVKFLRTPILKSICEQLLLLIVIFAQENNHIQCWHELPEPKLHKKLTCVMLVHSPQKTFHRTIIYNFVWIYLSRSSRPDVFCKKGDLKNVAKLTGKHLCQSIFFNKVGGLCKKREIGTGVVKFLITRFFTELLRWLLLSGPTLQKEITSEMLAYG